MDEDATLSVSVPARADAVPFVRDPLGCFSAPGADEESVDAIKLAVHEAAANAVEHADDGGSPRTLQLSAPGR